MSMPKRPLIAAGLWIAAVAGAAQAARDDWKAMVPAGKPLDCIPIISIDHTAVRDDRTVDFVMRGRRAVYRNTLPNTCPELGFEQSFAYQTSLSQLCSVDLITVLRHTGPIQRGATCGLGTFQPVQPLQPGTR